MEGGLLDAYRTLGVAPGAALEEVKAAYKTLALKYHPDKNKSPDATKNFQVISSAYKHVCDNLEGNTSIFEEEAFADEMDMGESLEEMLAMFDMLFRCVDSSMPFFDSAGKNDRMGMSAFSSFLHEMNEELMQSVDEDTFMSPFISNQDDFFDDMTSFEEAFVDPSIARHIFDLDEESEDEYSSDSDENIDIDTRVRVHDTYTGTVKFRGPVHYTKGEFLGIALDNGNGKNDGTVKGVTYFECPPLHGLMVRPAHVKSIRNNSNQVHSLRYLSVTAK